MVGVARFIEEAKSMVDAAGTANAAGTTPSSSCSPKNHQPLSLRRNLHQARASNSRQLRNGEWHEKQTMATASAAEVSWEPPSSRLIEKLAKRRQPQISVQIKSIRSVSTSKSLNIHQYPSKARLPRMDCEIEIAIWEVSQGQRLSQLVRAVSDCRLQARQTNTTAMPEFCVTMKPLVISTDKLECHVGDDENWHRGLASNYHMDVRILFQSSKDAIAYFSLTDREMLSSNYIPPPMRTHLVTRWCHFPLLPNHSEPLPLYINFGGENAPTPYSLEIVTSFRSSDQSIMAEHNCVSKTKATHTPIRIARAGTWLVRSQSDMRNGGSKRVPPATRTVAGSVRVGFVWPSKEALISVKGFCCVICKAGRRFPSHENLQQHLRKSHRYFQVEVADATHGQFARLDLDYIIDMSVAPGFSGKTPDTPPFRSDSEGGRRNSRVAHKRPFSAHRHLDDGGAGIAQRTKRQRISPPKQALPRLPLTAPSSTAPEDVRELPERPRIKVRFPKIAGGRPVFKLDSKRQLHYGDIVSESDDDIDTEWMRPRFEELIKKSEVTEDCAKFSYLWNGYLERNENFSGDAFLGDAVVRFLRQQGDDFVDKTLNDFMNAFLETCHTNGILQDSFFNFAQTQLRQKLSQSRQIHGATETPTNTPLRRGRSKKSDSQTREAASAGHSPSSVTPTSVHRHSDPRKTRSGEASKAGGEPMEVDPSDKNLSAPQEATESSTSAPSDRGHCVCGKEVDTMYRIIICGNLVSLATSVGRAFTDDLQEQRL